MTFTLSAGRRFGLFVCLTIFCYIVTSLIVGFMALKAPANQAVMRIAAVVQDLVLFILPAISTAMLITRLPATFLGVDAKPRLWPVISGILVMLLAIAPMNAVIAWNAGLHLPESLAGLEQLLRATEEAAAASVSLLMAGNSVGSLIVSILIVGVLAGFSEELFFRGTLQRLFVTSRMNKHLAVWLTAFIFSAFHMQFFGFVPRLLLGAFFGYALIWSGSLWLPVILHVTNNTIYIVGQWSAGDALANKVDTFGVNDALICIVMGILTAVAMRWMWGLCKNYERLGIRD